MTPFDRSLVWIRRDLRLFDHTALYQALRQSRNAFCVFLFDSDILDPLRRTRPAQDRRVEFIHASLLELDAGLRRLGGALLVRHGRAAAEIPQLAAQLGVEAVFVNRDYEPQAMARDAEVGAALARDGRVLHGFKDQVVFEKDEVVAQSGRPFSVFTPYKNAWRRKLDQSLAADHAWLAAPDIEPYAARLAPPAGLEGTAVPALAQLGFEPAGLARSGVKTGMSGGRALLQDFAARIHGYGAARDFPAVKGPSYLSVHLRFGTVSIRSLVQLAMDAIREGAAQGNGAEVWLSELVWREFYFMILHHHPHVVERAFKPEYDRIEWESGPAARQAFQAWCDGRTGYPLLDAAMTQLNQTGYMHNRLRMVSACFLVKDLGIDWRWGERYFAQRLIDFDLAANNGGWQWAASSGCDAQPWFRIFNPVTQSEKFDADGKFIRRYLPHLARLSARDIHAPWLASPQALADAGVGLGRNYPLPLVQHEDARKRTLARYAVVKKTVQAA